MTIDPTDVMQVLKKGTAACHESIEGKMTVMRPGFSIDEYKVMLAKFYSFYAPYERVVLNNPYPELLNIQGRLRMPALKLDLQVLKIAPPAHEAELPEMKTPAQRLGALYVTEGSTLGGQIISRHLAKSLDLPVDQGLSFFAGYGKETGPMWKMLCSVLRTELGEPSALAEAVQAANKTFSALERCF